jgi:hypothetical protein
MTKIKKDFIGLYVTCGGYIARPTPNRWSQATQTVITSSFKEGDEVKAHHTGGSTRATIKSPTVTETWATQSISNYEYVKCRKNLSKEEFEQVVSYHSDKNPPNHNDVFDGTYDRIKNLIKKAMEV